MFWGTWVQLPLDTHGHGPPVLEQLTPQPLVPHVVWLHGGGGAVQATGTHGHTPPVREHELPQLSVP